MRAAITASSLRGVFAPITTPFDQRGHVDLAALRSNAQYYLRSPLRGLVVLGTTGEWPSLTRAEAEMVLTTVREVRHEMGATDKLLLAGTGSLGCEQDVVSLSHHASASGPTTSQPYDGVLILPPFYYKPVAARADVITAFYKRMAQQINVPIVLYSMPRCVGFEIPAETIGAVCSLPNIIGIKDSSGDDKIIAGFVQASKGQDFSVITGNGSKLQPHLALGAVGGILALANVLPAQTSELYKPLINDMQNMCATLNGAFADEMGGFVPNVKNAMTEYLQLYGGPCRDPLPRTVDSTRIAAVLRDLNLTV